MYLKKKNKMKLIKPIKERQEYINKITHVLDEFFYYTLFEPIKKIVSPVGELHNAVENALIVALRKGEIQYINGKFYGKFNAEISRILIKMGARFNKVTKTYDIVRTMLPMDVISAIAVGSLVAETVRKQLLEFLATFNVDTYMPELKKVLDVPLDEIIEDLDDKQEQAIKEAITIVPDFSEENREFLKSSYIENVEYSVTNFTNKEVQKLREMVEYNTYYGYSKNNTLINRIQKEFDIAHNKAKFIATQETRLLKAHLNEMRLREVGITHYKWVTSHDERVRDTHKDLNGKIFAFDTPPIVNKFGDRKNPSEDFGCRCQAIGVLL